MKRLNLLFLGLLLVAGGLHATAADETTPAPASPPITDSATLSDHYHAVLARPEFQETEETGIDSRLRDALTQFFTHLGAKFGEFRYASEIPGIASLFLTLLVAVIVAGFLYVGLRLPRNPRSANDENEMDAQGDKKSRVPENFEEEIQRAVEQSDWQRAWLATWRQFLSRLEAARLAEPDRSRTNREYLAQVRREPVSASGLSLLVTLVDAYDQFIYGRHPIDAGQWHAFRDQVNEAALLLHLDAPKPVSPGAAA
jgi:hypothetical protein